MKNRDLRGAWPTLQLFVFLLFYFWILAANALTFINNYPAVGSATPTQEQLPLSSSIFVSNATYNKFTTLSPQLKTQVCGFNYYQPNWDVINWDLAPKISGFNSRMDNADEVQGVYSRKVLKKYLEAITFAMVSEDMQLKEDLFDKLYIWASEDALSATKQCYSRTFPSIKPSCRGEWTDPDGQDLAPIKDSTVAIEIVMALNYVYNLYYASYQVQDIRHKNIKKWFKSFYHRIKSADKFYFGNSAGWYFPNIAIQHNQGNSYKDMVEQLVKGLNNWTFEDGSLKDRTTRGNRALWYHHTALGEAFIIMEIAKTANVPLPSGFERKLLKAAELFQDSYLDHSVIEPWAKQRHNGQASNGYQKFNDIEYTSYYAAWFHILQSRYPEHRTAKWFEQQLSDEAKSLRSNIVTGVNLACIHKALSADNR